MKEVIGCGIDIEEPARFRKKIPKPGHRSGFVRLVYTDYEIENNLKSCPDFSFPLGFSCKEAFFKSFGLSWTNSSISWKDIELLFADANDLQKYEVRLGGFAKELYRKKKCRSFESFLEYTPAYVMFQVVLLS
jgi:phosphopantetheine--protein transferase-like protein